MFCGDSPFLNLDFVAAAFAPQGYFWPHEAWCRYADPGPHPCAGPAERLCFERSRAGIGCERRCDPRSGGRCAVVRALVVKARRWADGPTAERAARAEPPPTAANAGAGTGGGRRGWLPCRPRTTRRPARGDGPCRIPRATRQARGGGEEVTRHYRGLGLERSPQRGSKACRTALSRSYCRHP